MDSRVCVEKTGSDPRDRLRECGDLRLRNGSENTNVDPSPKESPEKDVIVKLS